MSYSRDRATPLGGLAGRRGRALPIPLGILAGLALALPAPSRAQPEPTSIFVNTTRDGGITSDQCLPGRDCTLRKAIELAESLGGGIVRACYDPAETPDGKPCPRGWKPLSKRDRGYDAASGRWRFDYDPLSPFVLSGGNVVIDFTRDIEGWDGPEDNRVALLSEDPRSHAIIVESSGNQLAGLELGGAYTNAAIVLRKRSREDIGATDNLLGPGLIFADIQPGVGLLLRDPQSFSNRLVGSWCGITGDGRQTAPMYEDCIQISSGAHDNQIGGPDPADRNVLAASGLGSAVSVLGFQPGAGGENPPITHDNVIEGNWIGLDAAGEPVGNESGVTIKLGAVGTILRGNLISGNRQAGVAIYNASHDTRIEDNAIGLGPDRRRCASNGRHGIEVVAEPKGSRIVGNDIACNGGGGIVISGRRATGHSFSANRLRQNQQGAIVLSQGANGDLRAPKVDAILADLVQGTACAGCRVEVFSTLVDQADAYEGAVQADAASGAFTFRPEAPGFRFPFLTLTVTDAEGNTSALSRPQRVPRETATPAATNSPTAEPSATSGPAPTRDPSRPAGRIHLPFGLRAAALADLAPPRTALPPATPAPGATSSPTSGPTVEPPTATGMPSPSPIASPTPPIKRPGTIRGRLTVDGDPATEGLGASPGPGLVLQRCRPTGPGAFDLPDCGIIDRVGVVGDQGGFAFADPIDLEAGQFYRVAWINESASDSGTPFFGSDLWLGAWYSEPIALEPDGEVDLGRIELADISLTDPQNGIGTSLPIEFRWSRRTSETGSYQLAFVEAPSRTLADREVFHAVPAGRRGSYTLNARPPGMRVGIDFRYFWLILIDDDRGQGQSYYNRMFWLESFARRLRLLPAPR